MTRQLQRVGGYEGDQLLSMMRHLIDGLVTSHRRDSHVPKLTGRGAGCHVTVESPDSRDCSPRRSGADGADGKGSQKWVPF